MKVQLVTWDDDPPVGGQGVYVRELRTSLAQRGVTVATTAGRGPHAMGYPRLTGKGHIDMAIALHRSIRPLVRDRPDLLHLSGGPGGLLLLRRVSAPVVYTAHHTYRQAHARRGPKRAVGRLEAASYRRATRIAAVSPSTADSVVEMGVPADRVVVISPGVRARPPGCDDLDGVERQPGRMLFVGRLEPEKGVLDAVAAMGRVSGLVRGATGHVVGRGSQAAAAAASVRASGWPVTLRGTVDDHQLWKEYRRAEVVLMPSAIEGLGLVALEAMAAGAAVVGYDVPGLHDTVGADGVLVPHGDVAGLTAAARALLTDGARRAELTAQARHRVLAERSWDACAARFEELYGEALAGPPP